MATVDSVAVLALVVAAVVGTVLVRSNRQRQALEAEQAARFAPLVALFGDAGRPGALVRDTYRGRAYLMRRVGTGETEAAGEGRVVVEIEMPSFGASRWRIARRDAGGGGELVADDAELRRILLGAGVVALVAGVGDDDLTVGYDPRRQCMLYRERADRRDLGTGWAVRRRLDAVFELTTLNESAQRI